MGYAVRKRLIGENGRFDGYCYTVTDIPETDITTDGNTVNGKSVNGFSINGKSINRKSTTTNNINNKEINNKETLNGGGFENPPNTPTPDNIINVDVEEITGDTISVNTETITPPSSAAPPSKMRRTLTKNAIQKQHRRQS
jgi:hypothetical protein